MKASNLNFVLSLILLFLPLLNFAQNHVLWAGNIDTDISSWDFFSNEIDQDGNQIIIGTYRGTPDFDFGDNTSTLFAHQCYQSTFIQKLSPSGELIWIKEIGEAYTKAYAGALHVDEENNIYVLGFYYGSVDFYIGSDTLIMTSNGFADAYLVKINSEGDFLWAKSFGGIESEYPRDIKTDRNNDIFIIGHFSGLTDFDPGPANSSHNASGDDDDGFLLKLDENGNYLWAKTTTSVPRKVNYCHDVEPLELALDRDHNIYITGTYFGTMDFDPGAGVHNHTADNVQDIFIQKLDSAGNFLWGHSFGGDFSDLNPHIKVDNAGDVILAGTLGSDIDADPGAGISLLGSGCGQDGFLIKFSPEGNHIWSQNLGNDTYEQIEDIHINANNDIFIIGHFEGIADFYFGNRVQQSIAMGGSDAYVAKINSLGNYMWHKTLPTTLECKGLELCLDENENMYLLGSYSGTFTFSQSSGVADLAPSVSGNSSIFVLKLGSSTNNAPLLSMEDLGVSVFPNPTQGLLKIKSEELSNLDLTLTNQSGQIILHKSSKEELTVFDLSQYAAGIYYLNIKDGNRTVASKVIKY